MTLYYFVNILFTLLINLTILGLFFLLISLSQVRCDSRFFLLNKLHSFAHRRFLFDLFTSIEEVKALIFMVIPAQLQPPKKLLTGFDLRFKTKFY